MQAPQAAVSTLDHSTRSIPCSLFFVEAVRAREFCSSVNAPSAPALGNSRRREIICRACPSNKVLARCMEHRTAIGRSNFQEAKNGWFLQKLWQTVGGGTGILRRLR